MYCSGIFENAARQKVMQPSYWLNFNKRLDYSLEAMERTSRKAYQRREKLLDGRESRFQRNKQRKNFFFIKSSGIE